MNKMLRNILSAFTPQETRIDSNKPDAPFMMATSIKDHLDKLSHDSEYPVVVLCIGTDRSTGDSLGPLVGSFLTKKPLKNYVLFGTLEEPVHAGNLKEFIATIEKEYPHSLVLAIDACLGRMESIGYITLGCGSLEPGAGVKKDLPAVGDIYVKGVVNVGGFMEYLVLQNTRLSLVMKMAQVIADGLYRYFSTHCHHQPINPSHYTPNVPVNHYK